MGPPRRQFEPGGLPRKEMLGVGRGAADARRGPDVTTMPFKVHGAGPAIISVCLGQRNRQWNRQCRVTIQFDVDASALSRLKRGFESPGATSSRRTCR